MAILIAVGIAVVAGFIGFGIGRSYGMHSGKLIVLLYLKWVASKREATVESVLWAIDYWIALRGLDPKSIKYEEQ